MLEVEATWLKDQLADLPAESLSPLLNLGSSDLEFRTRWQPWIDGEVFAPLRARGVAVVHADLKPSEGVDLVADALQEADWARLQAVAPRAVMCSNMLEHVEDRALLAGRCAALVPPGGHLIVTVPASYPYHADPIDTYFRPTPAELVALFPDLEVVAAARVEGPSYAPALLRRPWLLARDLVGLARAWRHPGRARLAWLARRYAVSAAVLRRPG